MLFPSGHNICLLLKILLNLSQEFQANSKFPPEKVSVISPPIIGQYLRINPRSWKTRLSMAIEFYGCYLVDNRNGKRLILTWIVQGFPYRVEKNMPLIFHLTVAERTHQNCFTTLWKKMFLWRMTRKEMFTTGPQSCYFFFAVLVISSCVLI